MRIIPVITLWQPWASWIMWGWKGIESRTHNRFKKLVGEKELGIHAGQRFDKSDLVMKNIYLSPEAIKESMNVPLGCLLGTVNCYDGGFPLNWTHENQALIECEKTTRYGLFVKDPIPFEKPVPMKGELSIWYLYLDTMQKVKKIIKK